MTLADALKTVLDDTHIVVTLNGDEIYNGLRCDIPDNLVADNNILFGDVLVDGTDDVLCMMCYVAS